MTVLHNRTANKMLHVECTYCSFLFANMYTVRSSLFQSLGKQNCLPACLSTGRFFWLLEKCPTFLEEHILCVLSNTTGRKLVKTAGLRPGKLEAAGGDLAPEDDRPLSMSGPHQWVLTPHNDSSLNTWSQIQHDSFFACTKRSYLSFTFGFQKREIIPNF